MAAKREGKRPKRISSDYSDDLVPEDATPRTEAVIRKGLEAVATADVQDCEVFLAQALEGEGDDWKFDATVRRLKVLLRDDLTNDRIHFLLGKAAFYEEDDAAAMEYLTQALNLNNRDAEYHHMMGVLQQYIGDNRGCLVSLRQAVTLAPGSGKYWFEFASANLKARKTREATEAFQQVLKCEPGHLAALRALAGIHMEAGHGAAAASYHERILSIVPDDPPSLVALAEQAVNASSWEQARGLLVRARRVDPDDWRILERLVQVSSALQQHGEADSYIAELYRLQENGMLDDEQRFLRERMPVGRARDTVDVFEYFSVTGGIALKYLFVWSVMPPAAERSKVPCRVSLGSYDAFTTIARATGQIKADERVWHLDGYYRNDKSETYKYWKRARPEYPAVRDLAIRALLGTVSPVKGGPSGMEHIDTFGGQSNPTSFEGVVPGGFLGQDEDLRSTKRKSCIIL